ncbi:MAG: GNAT family N-acetyltransferase [Clostridia bacterium]|nr:GNAT family N-acetyltransferase [Clostridia bacterium]
MQAVVFEEIKEEHLDAVLDIYNYYVLNSTATFHIKPLDKAGMRDLVFFENPKYKAFVIINDSEICGYCILTQFRKREAYNISAEVTVYLKNGYTGKGIGSLAVRHIETLAKRNAIHVLIAGICGENNSSIRLFEKNGYMRCACFKEVGSKFGKLLDLVYYQKILRAPCD